MSRLSALTLLRIHSTIPSSRYVYSLQSIRPLRGSILTLSGPDRLFQVKIAYSTSNSEFAFDQAMKKPGSILDRAHDLAENRRHHSKPNPYPHLKPKICHSGLTEPTSTDSTELKAELSSEPKPKVPDQPPKVDPNYHTKVVVTSGFTVAGFCVLGPLGGFVGYAIGRLISDK